LLQAGGRGPPDHTVLWIDDDRLEFLGKVLPRKKAARGERARSCRDRPDSGGESKASLTTISRDGVEIAT
jgi:hypothetical protein